MQCVKRSEEWILARGAVRREAMLWDSEIEAIGTWALGPVLAGFTTWLETQFAEYEVAQALYVSREGKYLAAAAQTAGVSTAASYLPCSRALMNRMVVGDDIFEQLLTRANFQGTVAGFARGRFGLDANDVRRVFSEKECVKSLTLPRELDVAVELTARIVAIHGEAFSLTKQNFIDSFRQRFGDDQQRFAVVDVGYMGTLQMLLEHVLGIESVGLYFVSEAFPQLGEKLLRCGWLATDAVRGVDDILPQSIVLELLLQSNSGQVVDYQELLGEIQPVTKNRTQTQLAFRDLDVIQEKGLATLAEVRRDNAQSSDIEAFGRAVAMTLLQNWRLLPQEFFAHYAMDDEFSGQSDAAVFSS